MNNCKYWKCYEKDARSCTDIDTHKECGDCHDCISCEYFDEAYPENDGYCWRYEERENK